MEKEAVKRARNRERAAQRRAMETESERSHRLEASRRYSAEKRARESEEKKAERRMMDRKRAAERRARESQWEREHRLAVGRQRAAERRAAESVEEREHRLAQNRERLASKRASKAEKPTLEATAMLPALQAGSDEPLAGVRVAKDGDLIGYGQEKAVPTCLNGAGVDFHGHGVEGAGLAIATATSGFGHLLPVGVMNASRSTSTNDVHKRLEVMASASVVQPPQEQHQQQVGATTEQTAPPSTSTSAAIGGGEKSSGELKQEVLEIKEFRAVEPNLERHYNDLLKVISEIGRDVKPAYTNNKVSTDRLRKNIMMARGIVRECVQDVDRLATIAQTSSTSSSQSSSNAPPTSSS